jgi:hypothetical protein
MSEVEERRIKSQKRLLNAKLIQQRQFMQRFEAETCAPNIYEAELRGILLDGYLKEYNQLTMELSIVLADGPVLEEAEADCVRFEEEIANLKRRLLARINKHPIVQPNPHPMFQFPPQDINPIRKKCQALEKVQQTRHGQAKPQTQMKLNGISENPVTISSMDSADIIASRTSPFQTQMNFLIIPRIARIPDKKLKCQPIQIPSSINLADPQFATPNQIDLIIGSEVFLDILKNEKKSLTENKPSRDCFLIGRPLNTRSQHEVQGIVHCFLKRRFRAAKMFKIIWILKLNQVPPPCNQHKLVYTPINQSK